MRGFIIAALIVYSACICSNCAHPDKEVAPKTMGYSELNRAIDAIEDRRNAEVAIIREQERAIVQLKENMEQVNTEGMRRQLSKEIFMKNLAVEKAKSNMANQDSILTKLYLQRDSLLKMNP